MHPRYSHPAMEELWSLPQQYQRWLLVEQAIARAGVRDRVVPEHLPDLLTEVDIDDDFIEMVSVEETLTRHDVAAFVNVLCRLLDADDAHRFVHFGATSSDVVDTALSLAVQNAAHILLTELTNVQYQLDETRRVWGVRQGLQRVGRTHGRVAARTTVDHILHVFGNDFESLNVDIDKTADAMPGKIAGPLGDRPILSQQAERDGLKPLSLFPVPYATQVISRDYLIAWTQTLERLTFAVERLATWIRFESIQGVDQLVPRHIDGQQISSSSMPHKRNPIAAETLCGLMRMVRSNLRAVADSSVLWADRDMTHSSIERVALPDACVMLAHGLVKTREMLTMLEWKPDKTEHPGIDSFDRLHMAIRDGADRQAAHHQIKTEQGLR